MGDLLHAYQYIIRILLTEAYVNNEDLMKFYGDMKSPGIGSISQLPINFNLLYDTTAHKVT